MRRSNAVMFLLLILVALPSLRGSSPEQERCRADLVVRNALIVTMDAQNPRAECLAVKGERIVFVGKSEGLKDFIDPSTTRIVDARGHLLIPGFNDAHLHFMSGSIGLLELDLRYIPEVAEVQRRLSQIVTQTPKGQLIQGRGWDHELFPDKRWPHRSQLDRVAPDHPVVLKRCDGHSVWVNSLVIRKAGINAQTADPPGGTILRDEKGEPTGIFKESAVDLLELASLFPMSEAERAEREYRAILEGLAHARKLGVTSFQHLNGNADLFERILTEGRLSARVTFNLELSADPAVLNEAERQRNRYPRSGNWIRFGYLKGFIDGTLGSGTALFFEPFADNPATSGLAQMSREELERQVLAADARGFQIGIHAIGDKGNHWILDAYEKAAQVNGRRDSRHRSEHAQVLRDDDIPRFSRLGVIASMQPTHCITDKRFAEKRLGLKRCKGAYAWRRLLQAGTHVAFGTDWPVEPLDPMEGLYAAVTRKDRGGESGDGWFPDQRLSMEEAIRLYTAGSAYAEFMEDRKGVLREGMLADMIILDRNLLEIPPEMIMKTNVDLTIVGGRVVYDRWKEE